MLASRRPGASVGAFAFGCNSWKTTPTVSMRFFVFTPRMRDLVAGILQFMQFAQFLLHGHESSVKNRKDFINRVLILTFQLLALSTLVNTL
jgi:hypothetical protein